MAAPDSITATPTATAWKRPAEPKRGLTPLFIQNVPPPPEGSWAYEIADKRAPGLRLRVNPPRKHSQVFTRIFRWYSARPGGGQDVITIGPWAMNKQPGFVTLEQARKWLEDLKAAKVGGTLPAVEAELQAFLRRRPAPEVPASSPDRRIFGPVAEEFYRDEIEKRRKRPKDARHILDVDILPVLGARPLDDITTLECRDVVKRTIDRGAPVHAGKVLATLKQLFGWAQSNGYTERNPAAPLKGDRIGVEVNASDRWLTDVEIPIFWRALDAAMATGRQAEDGHLLHDSQKLRPATAAALRILLLAAVRTGELLQARWEHVDLDERKPEPDRRPTWTIPVANQKLTKKQERKAKPFMIPLTPTAVALFAELRELAGKSPWVMASDDASPPRDARGSPQGVAGHYRDKTLGRAVRRLQAGKAPILVLPGGSFSPHDLRRTARTHLAKLGTSHWICERVLNHSLGKIGETYDRHDYLDERREALLKWDAYVARLLAPEQSNVAFLPTPAVAP